MDEIWHWMSVKWWTSKWFYGVWNCNSTFTLKLSRSTFISHWERQREKNRTQCDWLNRNYVEYNVHWLILSIYFLLIGSYTSIPFTACSSYSSPLPCILYNAITLNNKLKCEVVGRQKLLRIYHLLFRSVTKS